MSETIAAISTALSSSGIGIVRISGEEAIKIADRIFRMPLGKRLADCPPNTIHYGHIMDGEQTVDEVLAMLMRAPHSYTTEDTVEFDCHGGVYVVKKVLSLALTAGARLADPGEFTKRAFLAGRLDLSQAEAVMSLISAENDYALDASVKQLRGDVSDTVRTIGSEILFQMAYIESALDDPEHYTLDDYGTTLRPYLEVWRGQILALIQSYDNGRFMTEGIRTVIMGKPNAGKSSVLNLLIGTDRAIVTEVPGTTRDVLEEKIQLNGISLILLDTAGIRKTSDPVERIGIERAMKNAQEADLILFVLDMDAGMDENDLQIADAIADKPVIVLLNKSDLLIDESLSFGAEQTAKLSEQVKAMMKKLPPNFSFESPIIFSATERKGLKELTERIQNRFFDGQIKFNNQVVITNLRHRNLLDEAWKSLCLVVDSVDNSMPEDLYIIDLMDAYEKLGQILGEEVGDDLVNEIFSRFCMGK